MKEVCKKHCWHDKTYNRRRETREKKIVEIETLVRVCCHCGAEKQEVNEYVHGPHLPERCVRV